MKKTPKPEKDNLFKQWWDVVVERHRTRKALRILNTQTWSLEFLQYMLVRSAKSIGQPLQMQVVSPDGAHLIISTVDRQTQRYKDDDIFNHLDDEVKIKQFMESIK